MGSVPRAGRMGELWSKADKTLHHHTRRMIKACRGLWWDLRRLPAERPVIVVGCSRAGTTLVYKTLSEAGELASLQRETHDFWAGLHPLPQRDWHSHALGAEDACARDREVVSRYFYKETGRRRFVDKNNQNGLCVDYLRALFPDAHFVYVKRSPGDNINSLIEGWSRPEEFSTWANELPAKVAVDGGRYTRWCFFLAEGWRDYLRASIEEVCAFQYRTINEAVLRARPRVPPGQWTELKYEQLLRDPVDGFRSVFEACGLTFGPKLEAHCREVLANPYNAFFEIREDKWKESPHRDRVERALPLVRDVAKEMGYQP